MEYKFSILIPAYKKKFFRECVDSILHQTYIHFEIIILNDASPEDLEDVVRDYSDERIKYYRNQSNVGAIDVVDNWNKCLALSNGDYIICMGDDDKLQPDCLEEYSKLIEKHPEVNVFHTRSMIIDEKSVPYQLTASRAEFETVYDYMYNCLINPTVQFVGDFLYRADYLKRNGGFYKLPLAWGSDYITSFIAASKNGIVHTNKILFSYRQNRQSITSGAFGSLKYAATKEKCLFLKDFIEQCNPQTENEKIMKKMIQERLPQYSFKMVTYELANILKKKRIYISIYYLFCRKRYGISYKMWFAALLKSVV